MDLFPLVAKSFSFCYETFSYWFYLMPPSSWIETQPPCDIVDFVEIYHICLRLPPFQIEFYFAELFFILYLCSFLLPFSELC